MATYRPMGMRELQNLLHQAAEEQVDVLTRHQRQLGMGLDFQYFNHITDLDLQNLTVTAERDVLLGDLERTVEQKGLHVPFYTPDLETVRLGDFFAEQMLSLTNGHHNQPRFQVLGLEVVLVDGTPVSFGGKTMKNVTGYDMVRLFISNRESLGIPIRFTLKLVSEEEIRWMMLVDIPNSIVLRSVTRGLRETDRKPTVCLYWNEIVSKRYDQGKTGRLFVMFSGSRERVSRDSALFTELMKTAGLQGTVLTNGATVWKLIRRMRQETLWANGMKVPSLSCVEVMEELQDRNIGMWYSLPEGNLQLMPLSEDAIVYRSLCRRAELLGGAGNHYLQSLYQLAPAGEMKMFAKLKQQYDPDGRLNPMAGGMSNDTWE